MSDSRPLAPRHAVAVALGLPLGAGVFLLPSGVENLGGPATPVAYLVGTLAVGSVAVAYAVFLSSPLVERDAPLYTAVSRTWGSRPVGFLAAWPTVGAYVAVLAALAASLGAAAATVLPLPPTPAALAALAALVAVHALGPAAAGRAQLWVTVPLLALLGGMLLVGATAVVPDNFSPLLPTPPLRERPLVALGGATVAALFGFAGFDAGAAVSSAVDDPRRTVPRALLVAVLLAGAVATLAAVVTLGVIPWSRLVFVSAPFAEAAASALGVAPRTLLVPGTALAGVGAALATAWLPARTLRGVAEVVPGLDRETRRGVPDPALAVTGLLAGAVVALDLVGYASYLALAGIFVGYAAIAASVGALPLIRPELHRRCRLRLPAPALVAVSLAGLATAGVVLARVATLDPASTLGFSRWGPALAGVDDAVLVRDPLSTVVPALLLWELLGVAVVAVAADYRADRGVDRPPLDAAYEE
ncbi:APC family permease [Haloplanus halophilus]|uniref:APC family permease n=1 Tax=Haloplanus halophilus TaxID=2949993 RepID=UPI0020404D9B|nr:amino acid permease [Haloplanus sp. GDY1]